MTCTHCQRELLNPEAWPEQHFEALCSRCALIRSQPTEFWCYGEDCWDAGYAAAKPAWQPIDTAPKDKAILGYAGGAMATVWWHDSLGCGYWSLCEVGSFAEDGEWNPTHWQPLPDPPKEGT